MKKSQAAAPATTAATASERRNAPDLQLAFVGFGMRSEIVPRTYRPGHGFALDTNGAS